MKRKLPILFVATVIVFLTIIVFFVSNASYSRGFELDKQYVKYQVQKDDNLTCITKQMDSEYNVLNLYTLQGYIDEVKSINSISRDIIYAGDTLILPVIMSN